MKQLPISIQSFGNFYKYKVKYVYVDKTDMIYNLISNKAVFLSRPRRFGKSLLLSTVKELFNGNKKSFKDLKIKAKKYNFEKFPIIHLDMSTISGNPQLVEKGIILKLNRIASAENLNLKADIPGQALEELIEGLHDKYKKDVVILIDEYDAPVSSNIGQSTLAEENSQVLRIFYSSLKSCNEYLRFVFVTGVTRYGLMGLSAGLNHLYDISFDPQYAAICGFTLEEMDQFFGDRYPVVLEALKSTGYLPATSTEKNLRKKIEFWYDGYTWDGNRRVLNPVSILNFFKKHKFSQYWQETYPSVSFITNIMKHQPLEFTKDKLKDISKLDLTMATVDGLKPVPLLFQTGYLTIDKISIKKGKEFYSLKVPNFEIKDEYYNILNKILSNALVKNNELESDNLFEALKSRDGEKLTNIIGSLYAGLPAEHHQSSESFYHSLLWAYCSALVDQTRAEEPGAIGDLDLILVLKNGTHVVMELKYAKDEGQNNVGAILKQQAQKALAAIRKKQYGQRYRLEGKEFLTVGVAVFGRSQVLAVFGED
ncbi:MAG: ATP-binding protein [Deltaproteobacteria bacterium]|jgi:hypothetical protein|nr:ATP-binding protein [Deltaproteobacteria bacterium]